MAPYKSFPEKDQLYFVTSSIAGHKHLLNMPEYAQIILDSLSFLRREKEIKLYAFVIMPNHFHLIVKLPDASNISKLVHDLKLFTANQIIRKLQVNKELHLLDYFEQQAEGIKKQRYKVWETGFWDKNIFSEEFLLEKMEYIHNNPINKNWHLVEERSEYPFSSARFYDKEEEPIIVIDDIRRLLGQFAGGKGLPLTSK
ncbi:MAG: transposase [Dehalococcoidia bacterium]